MWEAANPSAPAGAVSPYQKLPSVNSFHRGTPLWWAHSNPTTLNEYDSGKLYYQYHEEELKLKYPGQYVAIWQGHVISHGEVFDEVAARAYEQVGYQEMYIPKVGLTKRKVRLRSPRVVQSNSG